jgi:threonylcarbamoyladenosine tRNA methylthiotransferase MtaB
VVLTGTQLGTYGFEVPGASLTGLVRRVLGETPVPRLRVSSLQAQEVTPELFDLWSDARLCPHFHLPLQSGSATVLRAMRRRYSPQQYLETVELIRQRLPEASVTADVIVGFPGETERDFRETYELCSRAGLAGVHVFPYSARPGTSALYIEPKVGEQEKRNRMRKMLALAGEQAHAYRSGLVGSVRPVLWEASRLAGDATAWSGLTDTHVRVATVSPLHLSNRITATQLDRQQGEVLWGTVAE